MIIPFFAPIVLIKIYPTYAIPEIKDNLPYIVQEIMYNPTISDLAYTLTGRPSTADAMQLVAGTGIFASAVGGLINILRGGNKIDKLLDKL